MTPNTHKVPLSAWKKWLEPSKALFNALYASMEAQRLLTHPKQPLLPDEYWETIRWNAAWLAAHDLTLQLRGD